MVDASMSDQSLALGNLIGTVNGLVKTLEEQNKSATEYRREQNEIRKEQNEAAAKNREEVLDIFKGLREDIKSSNRLVLEHMQLDIPIHALVKDMEPKVEALWDNQNKQRGAVLATGTIGSLVGGVIVALVEFFKK